jgi:hypothetical protein
VTDPFINDTQLSEKYKFRDSDHSAPSTKVAVEVENDVSNPVPVTSDPVQNPTIIEVSVVTAGVAVTQAIADNTKKLLIKSRKPALIELSFNAGFTEHITIPKGGVFEVSGLKTSSMTIYLKSSKIEIIEVLGWT